jgi:hypothetical protein
MRSKVTLALLFLNVVVFFFIFKFEPGWRTEHAAQEARRRVLGAEAASIQSLEIAGNGANAAPAVSLVKRGEDWFLTKPFEWPANPLAVQRILTDLQLLDHETSFTVADLVKNGQKLSDYGLEPPALTVTFSSADPAGTLSGTTPARAFSLGLGNKTPDGKLLYLLSADRSTVHVVGRSLAESLAQPIEQLRANTLFTIRNFEVSFFKIIPANVAPIHLRRDGSRWLFDAPLRTRANKVQTELAINELRDLRVKAFITALPADIASINPLRISLEGNNRSETLLLYAPVGPTPPSAEEVDYYARMDKKDALFTVALPARLKSRLDNAQVALRERRLLDFDPRLVSAISIVDESVPVRAELRLQRLDAPNAAAAESIPWQIVRSDAGQAPQTSPADLKVIQHFLEDLGLLSAREQGDQSGFISDAPTAADLENWGFNRPVRVITLTLAATPPAAPATLTVRIGQSADRRQVFARVGGSESVYEVDPEILRQTPVDPLAYRDRLLRELPTGAQITGLKLIDATNQAVLLDRQISTALAADDPLQALVVQLRTLRARSLVADHFLPAVQAGGEEQPWKYQLDVSIALGGGSATTPASTMTLFLTDRLGGTTQYAGSREQPNAVWELEQPFIDALKPLLYGARDPGPAPERR